MGGEGTERMARNDAAVKPVDGLMEKGIGAALWATFGAVLRTVLQIASQIVLARLLGPEAYGLFAVAMAIVMFASLFADLGLAYGLIQRPEVNDQDIRFVFTWQMVLGCMTTLALVMSSRLIAAKLGDPRLEPLIQTMALATALASLGTTSAMLLRRRLDFKTLNITMLISYIAGFVAIGIPMAWLGYGVWSLVAAYLVQITLAAVLSYAYLQHAIRPLFRHDDGAGILGFGTTVLVTNILNWVMMSLDRLIIGAAKPAALVGLYALMSNLVTTPVTTLISATQPALYATSARTQDDTAHLRTALLSVLGVVSLFVGPIFFAIGMAAETVVLAVYGPKWSGGGSILMPLAFAMPAFMLMGMAIPTLWASGRPTWEFKLQLPMALIWALVLFTIGTRVSIEALSWLVCLWFYLRACVILLAACRALGLRFPDIAAALTQGLLVTAAVAATAFAADHLGLATTAPAFVRLAGIILACAVALLLALRLSSGLMIPEVFRLIEGACQRLPNDVASFVLRRLIARTN